MHPTNDTIRLADGRPLHVSAASLHSEQLGHVRWKGCDGMTVVATPQSRPGSDQLHVSLAYPDRMPSWEDVQLVRDAFFSARTDAVILLAHAGLDPQRRIYPYCVHLWALPRP